MPGISCRAVSTSTRARRGCTPGGRNCCSTSPIRYQSIQKQIADAVPDSDRVAIRHLAKAVRLSGNLPRLGRWHLRALGTAALGDAVARARAGDEGGFRWSLGVLERALERRRAVYADMAHEVVRADGSEGGLVRRDEALGFSIATLKALQERLAAGDGDGARILRDQFAETLGEGTLLAAIDAWLAERDA